MSDICASGSRTRRLRTTFHMIASLGNLRFAKSKPWSSPLQDVVRIPPVFQHRDRTCCLHRAVHIVGEIGAQHGVLVADTEDDCDAEHLRDPIHYLDAEAAG